MRARHRYRAVRSALKLSEYFPPIPNQSSHPAGARFCYSSCYSSCYSNCLRKASGLDIVARMLDCDRLIAIRKKLGLSQEQMARLLGVSFTSVNRWEGGHSAPTGPTRDLYLALDSAIRLGHTPEKIRRAADAERSTFLYALFRMAYSKQGRAAN